MIIVDKHEHVNHTDTVESKLENVEWDVAELPAGDFAVEGQRGKALIERKEWTDFVAAYRSGTLFNQLNRCLEQEHDVHVLLEGSRRNAIEYAGARELELRRMVTSLHFKSPVGLIETNSFEETMTVVIDADDWLGRDPSENVHSVRPAEKVPAEDRPRFIVEGLPKVGPKNADRLLEEFGSARAIFTASVDELRQCEGIGPKRAESVVEALKRQYDD